MNDTRWYSAKLKLVAIVEPEGGDLFMESIYLFTAQDFDDAFKRALQIGRSAEHDYKNGEGQLVAWRFMEIVSLDVIPTDNLDGAEIFCEMNRIDVANRIPVGTQFFPEQSKPSQTI